MTFYSRYRRRPILTENVRAALCVVAILFLWGMVQDMDYHEQTYCEASK